MSRFSRFFGGISEGFRAARYNQALNQLSDRQLADIGLSRGELPRHALELARLKPDA